MNILKILRLASLYASLFVYMSVVLISSNNTLRVASISSLLIFSIISFFPLLKSFTGKIFLLPALPVSLISLSLVLNLINTDGTVSLQSNAYKLIMLLVGLVLPSVICRSNTSIFIGSLILLSSVFASNLLQTTITVGTSTRLINSETENIWEYAPIQMSLIVLNISTLYWRLRLKLGSLRPSKLGILEAPVFLLLLNFLIFLFFLSLQLKTTTRSSVISIALAIVLFLASLYINNKRLNKVPLLYASAIRTKSSAFAISCFLAFCVIALSWSSIENFFETVLYNFSLRGWFADYEGTIGVRDIALSSAIDVMAAHPLSMILFGVHSSDSPGHYIDSGFLRMALSSGLLLTSTFILSLSYWVFASNSILATKIKFLAHARDASKPSSSRLLPFLVAISSSSYLASLVFGFFVTSGYSASWFFAVSAILGSYYIPARYHLKT